MAAANNPFEAFFDLVPTGAALYAPLYDEAGELVDFRFARLNPAGQRLLNLPAQPARTFREYYPNSVPTGIFAQYRTAFLTGQAATYDVPYEGDGIDTYFRLVAQRSGDLLVVNFTDMADLPRSAVEQSLRESRAREQTARTEAEDQRQRFYDLLMQLPASMATYRGPDHVYELVNPRYQQLFRHRRLLGLPIREALPELQGQRILEQLDQVYVTGEAHYEMEQEVWVDVTDTSQPERRYYNVLLQPLPNAHGGVQGLLNFAYDVTEQVLARQQVEHLNPQLEARVQERTRELADHQRLLSQILAQVPAAITTLHGPDHRFTFANNRYQRLMDGRVRIGQTVAETLPEVAEQGFIELLDNVYRSSQTFEGKEIALLLAQPGSAPVQHYLDFTYQPLPNAHGQPQGVLVFAVDVTEQVRTRRQATALQAQLLAAAQHQATEREAFHHVFEQTPALVALLRAPGHRFEYVNPAYQALFAGRQLMGLDAAHAVPELQAQGVVALLDHVYQTGDTYFDQELPFARLSAPGQPPQPAYYSFTYQAYREQGQVAGVSIFGFDVTEQVLARRAAEASARQLRLITDALPVLISYLDRDEKYRFANLAYQPWFGLTPDQLLGRPIREIAGEQAYPTIRPYLERALAGERMEFEAEMPFRPHFHKHIRTTYIPDVHQGTVQGLYTLVTDITEQVEARQQVQNLNAKLLASNDELQESNRQLTRTNVDLDTFVYTASHDLKAPITNIEGILHALRDTLPLTVQQDEVVTHLLDLLDGTVSRFLLTIEQLTDLSRLQQTYNEPAQRLALAPVVAGVLADLAPSITAAAAQVQLDVAADLHVSFAPASLRSIVYNLLSNALKYRDPARPAQVWLRAEQQASGVVLSVRDNGLGLSEAQQERLFRAFQRLHTHVAGTGVGLYMIKRLIDNAGAKIAVTSSPGNGSTFTVTFPI